MRMLTIGLFALAVGATTFARALPATAPYARFNQAAPAQIAGLREGFEASLRAQLAHSLGQPESQIAVSMEIAHIEPALAISKVDSVQVLGLGATGSTRLDGLVSLAVVAQSGGRAYDLTLSGVLSVTGPVVTARIPMTHGHVIHESDLVVTRLPWRVLPNGAAGTSMAAVVGQRLRNFVAAGAPVYGELVDEPLAVKSGDMVEITVLSGPGVMIRSRAFARQEGRLGDFVRLEQPDTKKTLRGVVTGDKKVEVRL